MENSEENMHVDIEARVGYEVINNHRLTILSLCGGLCVYNDCTGLSN